MFCFKKINKFSLLESQENTKTISMKIGRYDRSPQLLMQDTKNANGRINWTPSMIENIRETREKALEQFSENQGAGGPLSKYWRNEWEKVYPDLNIDWKQVRVAKKIIRRFWERAG